jgi:hypothetical protein
MIDSKKLGHSISLILLCLITVLIAFNKAQAKTLEPISGRNLDVESILPADVLARTNLLADEIDLIRLELGKPKIQNSSEIVINASPRDVYFQAQTSFIKANRLLYEQTGDRDVIPPVVDVKLIQPFHVWQMVNKAFEQILKVKKRLNINEQSVEKQYPKNSSPSDVFTRVVMNNRQLKALIKQQFYPGDSFRKINESIHVMAALLATTPSVKRIPLAYAFERRKTPSDVYDYLIKTRSILIKIMSNYKVIFAHFQNNNNATKDKDAGDVYDLASLIAADLHYVHSFKLTAAHPAKTYLAGNKIPSDVYQRVSVLNQQLQILQKLHETHPNWLNQ